MNNVLIKSKTPLQSKTINASIANIVGVLALMAAFLGYNIDGDTQAEIVNHVDDIVVACYGIYNILMSLLAIYGRIKATKPISTKATIYQK